MIYKKIKELRINLNLSQEELANAVWLSRVAISQIELGERSIKTDELKRFADIFEVDFHELLWTEIPDEEQSISITDPHYKLKQLILYLSWKLISKENFWETLLNKLLYFIDFDYYERTGSSVTDEEYIKLPYGPVPKDMKDILHEMQQSGQIKIITRSYFGKTQKNIVPLVHPDVSFLDDVDNKNNLPKDEYIPYPDLPHPKKLIKEVLEKYGSRNADALSYRSHNDMPYLATKKIWDTISPGLVFYRKSWYVVNPHNLEDDQG